MSFPKNNNQNTAGSCPESGSEFGGKNNGTCCILGKCYARQSLLHDILTFITLSGVPGVSGLSQKIPLDPKASRKCGRRSNYPADESDSKIRGLKLKPF